MGSSSNRLVGLDIFRIISVLFIFLFHSATHGTGYERCYYGIFDNFISMGAIFMTAFFMLSGYSLYYTYQEKDFANIAQVKKFYIKRFINIAPAYYFIGIIYVFTLGGESFKENLLLFPVELLGIQSAFTSLFLISHNHGTWFISCFVLCYLLYPFFQAIVKQMTVKEKCIIMGICVFILLWSPFIVWKFKTASIYANPLFRLLEFYIGIVLCSMQELFAKIRILSQKRTAIYLFIYLLGFRRQYI